MVTGERWCEALSIFDKGSIHQARRNHAGVRNCNLPNDCAGFATEKNRIAIFFALLCRGAD
jgi:hypothetical protein